MFYVFALWLISYIGDTVKHNVLYEGVAFFARPKKVTKETAQRALPFEPGKRNSAVAPVPQAAKGGCHVAAVR